MHICATKHCRRKAKGRTCYRCEHEARKVNSPYRYWFGVLRRNARRRGVFFGLTFDYWVKWCDDTGYLALKGITSNSASVDRIRNELGYIDGNIQILSVSNNSSKGSKRVTWNYITKEWEIYTVPAIENKNQPF